QPTEVRITYRFHPRFGEAVLIRRCLERGGIQYFVVHQPDGSFACLPAWESRMSSFCNPGTRFLPAARMSSTCTKVRPGLFADCLQLHTPSQRWSKRRQSL